MDKIWDTEIVTPSHDAFEIRGVDEETKLHEQHIGKSSSVDSINSYIKPIVMENNENLAGTSKGIRILKEENTSLQKEPSEMTDKKPENTENIKPNTTDTKKEQKQLINRWKDFLIVPGQESLPRPQKTLSDSSSCSYCTEDDEYYSSGSDEVTPDAEAETLLSSQQEVKEPIKTTGQIITKEESVYQGTTSTAIKTNDNLSATKVQEYGLSRELQVKAVSEAKSGYVQNIKMLDSETPPQIVTNTSEKISKVKWNIDNLKLPTSTESVQPKFVQHVSDNQKGKSTATTNQRNVKENPDPTNIETNQIAADTRLKHLPNYCENKSEISGTKLILNPNRRDILNEQNLQHQGCKETRTQNNIRSPTQQGQPRKDNYPNMYAVQNQYQNQQSAQTIPYRHGNPCFENQSNTGHIQIQQSGSYPHPTSQSSIQQFPTSYGAKRFQTPDIGRIQNNRLPAQQQQPRQDNYPNTYAVQSQQSDQTILKGREEPRIENQTNIGQIKIEQNQQSAQTLPYRHGNHRFENQSNTGHIQIQQSDRFPHPTSHLNIQQFPTPRGAESFQTIETSIAYQPTSHFIPPDTSYRKPVGIRDVPTHSSADYQLIPQIQHGQMIQPSQKEIQYNILQTEPHNERQPFYTLAQTTPQQIQIRDVAHAQLRQQETHQMHFQTDNMPCYTTNQQIISHNLNFPSQDTVEINNYGNLPVGQSVYTIPNVKNDQMTQPTNQTSISDRHQRQQDKLQQNTSNKTPDRPSQKSVNKDQMKTFKRAKVIHNQQKEKHNKTGIPTYNVITKELDFIASPPVIFTPEYLMSQNIGVMSEQPAQFRGLSDNFRVQNNRTSCQEAGPSKKLKLEESDVSATRDGQYHERVHAPITPDANDAEKLVFNRGYKKYFLKTYEAELNTNGAKVSSSTEEDGHKLNQYSTLAGNTKSSSNITNMDKNENPGYLTSMGENLPDKQGVPNTEAEDQINESINIARNIIIPRTEEDNLLEQLESTFTTNSQNNNASKRISKMLKQECKTPVKK